MTHIKLFIYAVLLVAAFNQCTGQNQLEWAGFYGSNSPAVLKLEVSGNRAKGTIYLAEEDSLYYVQGPINDSVLTLYLNGGKQEGDTITGVLSSNCFKGAVIDTIAGDQPFMFCKGGCPLYAASLPVTGNPAKDSIFMAYQRWLNWQLSDKEDEFSEEYVSQACFIRSIGGEDYPTGLPDTMDTVAFGDINQDGILDAVGEARPIALGTAHRFALILLVFASNPDSTYTIIQDPAPLLEKLNIPMLASITSKGVIVFENSTHAKDDSFGWPSIHKKIKIRYNSSEFMAQNDGIFKF